MRKFKSVFQSVKRRLNELSANLVSAQSRQQGFGDDDQKRIAMLLALPLFTVLNLVTSPLSKFDFTTAAPLLAIALAVPFLAIGLLASSAHQQSRMILNIGWAPLAFLLVTQGHVNLLFTGLLLGAMLFLEAQADAKQRRNLAIGSILLVGVASICFAKSADVTSQLANIISFAPALIAGLVYFAARTKSDKSETVKTVSRDLEIVTDLSKALGFATFEISRTGHVTDAGSNTLAILGLEKSDVLGAAWLARVHVADKVLLLSKLDDTSQNGRTNSCQVRVQLAANTDKTTSWSTVGCTILKANNELLLILNAPSSITQIAQPAVLGTMRSMAPSALAIVSHELRTPLNAIIGFSDLLHKGMAGPLANERQGEYLGLIHESGQHLLELVNSILDLSKLENGTFELKQEEYLPEEAAQFALSLLAGQAQLKNLSLDYVPLSGFDSFSGDKRICRQILLNLLSNAVKFTPENGNIALRVEAQDHRLLITVEDNGIGMSSQQVSMAGTPFYQAGSHLNRMHEGAGLGLSLVRQMAKLHGGSIEIESQAGKGTTVRVALATLVAKDQYTSILRHPITDEAAQIIQLSEERVHVALRKTA